MKSLDLSEVLERKWLLMATGALIIGVGAFFLEVLPRFQAANSAYTGLRETRRAVIWARTADAELDSLQQMRTLLNREMDGLSSSQPCNDCSAHYFDQLRVMAEGAGLFLIRILPEDLERSEAVNRMNVDLLATGNYHMLGQFVEAVETAPESMNIRGLIIEADEAGATLTVMVKVEIVTLRTADTKDEATDV